MRFFFWEKGKRAPGNKIREKLDKLATENVNNNVNSSEKSEQFSKNVNSSEIDTKEYFNTAYQGTQGYIVLCAIPPEGGNLLIKGIYRTDRLSDMLNKAEALNGKYHLYTNIHPLRSRPQRGRGKESDILGVLPMSISHLNVTRLVTSGNILLFPLQDEV